MHGLKESALDIVFISLLIQGTASIRYHYYIQEDTGYL